MAVMEIIEILGVISVIKFWNMSLDFQWGSVQSVERRNRLPLQLALLEREKLFLFCY